MNENWNFKEVKENERRSRNWCFTLHCAEGEKELRPINGARLVDQGLCDLIVYQAEICPSTGKLHWQGYAEFSEGISRKTFKERLGFNWIHCKPRYAKSTRKACITYCTKDSSRCPDTEPFFFGSEKQQGHRSDLDDMVDLICTGSTLKDVLKKHRGNALRIIHCLEKTAKIHYGLSLTDEYIIMRKDASKLMEDIKNEDDDDRLSDLTADLSILTGKLNTLKSKISS